MYEAQKSPPPGVEVKKAKIGTAWIGRGLSWLEELMLDSFVATGHEVVLFSDVPSNFTPREGVEFLDMREVFDFTVEQRERMPAASFVDIFRLNMIAKSDYCWIDSDTISTGELTTWNDYLLVKSFMDEQSGQISNGFLSLPRTSAALNQMLEEISSGDMDYNWLRPRVRNALMDMPKEDRFIEAARLRRQVYGPAYVTSRLMANNELELLRPKDLLDPVPWDLTDLFFDPKGGAYAWFADETVGVHVALSQIRPRHIHKGPAEGSFLHNIRKNIQEVQ
ncbi:hypothetical protein [Celeribacter litoreus]|uniref:hypothetical protein n=1 Tax=Celeribacter litoreus TaxID=2876714 RepID=UPI001CC98651|nr:hypothetical protein [Celeribacter litoreus]MCA0042023.1 hypothetical protein [Celeribacter litoreus]